VTQPAAKPPVAVSPAVPAPAAASSAQPASIRPRPAKPKAGPRWVFEGMVYDLVTLRAVTGAQLAFRDASGKVCAQTTTREEGRYRVALEPLPGGYTLSVAHPDFQEKYIDDISPPFREVEPVERGKLVDMSARTRPWIGDVLEPTQRDFVMIPKRPAGPSVGR